MKRVMIFFKLLFFSVFATTKMLENVEGEIDKLTGVKDAKQSEKSTSEAAPK